MNIKKFSKETGISAHTLRYYEKIGLIDVLRDSKGHRDFSENDVKWVKCLKRLKATSMPLGEIKKFGSMRHACSGKGCSRLKVLEQHQVRLGEKRKELVRNLELIDEEIKMFKNWNDII